MPPVYHLHRRLSHADVDFLGELKVSALLGLLEQAAVEASTEAGYGARRYTEEGRVWIIRRTHLERSVPVGGGDDIEVRTQVSDFRRARSLRSYDVWRGATRVAEATTDWVYCDLRTGKPSRIPPDLQAAIFGQAPPTLPRPQALPAEGDEPAVEMAVEVRASHLDHVRHVNNAIYAGFLEDGAVAAFAARGWPLQRMLAEGGALRLARLDAEYLKDAGEGDALTVRTWVRSHAGLGGPRPEAAELLQAIRRRDGAEILRAASSWRWRRSPAVLGGVPE